LFRNIAREKNKINKTPFMGFFSRLIQPESNEYEKHEKKKTLNYQLSPIRAYLHSAETKFFVFKL
jgi:hypothetical protein